MPPTRPARRQPTPPRLNPLSTAEQSSGDASDAGSSGQTLSQEHYDWTSAFCGVQVSQPAAGDGGSASGASASGASVMPRAAPRRFQCAWRLLQQHRGWREITRE